MTLETLTFSLALSRASTTIIMYIHDITVNYNSVTTVYSITSVRYMGGE